MKVEIKHISTFLLIGLILLKVSSFHIYEHHDTSQEHDTECELCFLTIFTQQSDVQVPDLDIPQINLENQVFQDPIVALDFPILPSSKQTYFLSRPPPPTSLNV